ncbi:MAG: hypothetical protein AAF529_13315 [Pseudomonadota bacterium]
MSSRLFSVLLLAITTQAVQAEEIFAGIGVAGEVSYSDQPLHGHQRITLDVTPAIQTADDARATTAGLEALADELAQARQRREQARAASKRTSAGQARPSADQPVLVERYVEPAVTYFPGRFSRRQRTVEIEPAPPLAPRNTFEPAFRPFRQSSQ